MSGSEQYVPKFLNILLILKGQFPQGDIWRGKEINFTTLKKVVMGILFLLAIVFFYSAVGILY